MIRDLNRIAKDTNKFLNSYIKRQLKTGLIIFLSAIIGSAIPYFLFIKAQTKIDSSLNGILNSVTPLFTMLFGFLLFKQKINPKANKPGVLRSIEPPHKVANQLKILIPVGIAIIIVAAVK